MGMYDEYIPDPPIKCPYCGMNLEGWQSKDSECGLFIWKQGQRNPIDQKCDEEFKISKSHLNEFLLPKEFFIYGGDCPDCGKKDWKGWIQGCNCTCEKEVWTTTELYPVPYKAKKLDKNWFQCGNCGDASEITNNRNLFFCSSCKELNQLLTKA